VETAVIVGCGRCGTKNRIPEKRQHEGPRCGRCGEVIDLAAQVVPIELGDQDLQSFLAGSRLPVMVDFYSPDCGPCRGLAPVIEAMTRRFFGKVVVAKLNTRLHPNSALRYGIRGVPTLLFSATARCSTRWSAPLPSRSWLKNSAGWLPASSPVGRAWWL